MRASTRLRFPAPPFARATREPGHVRVWPSLLLAGFALAAFTLGGVAGFLLGFGAVLLIIDRTWPITGLLMTDAQHACARLARQRRLAALARRLKRRPADQFEAGAQRRTMGIQPIALDSIVGTTQRDKAKAFDRCFRPPAWSHGRWQLLWIARCRGTQLPPISVYRVDDQHYVRDGHHRVSVARALGETTIDAEVVQLGTPDPRAITKPRPATIDASWHEPNTQPSTSSNCSSTPAAGRPERSAPSSSPTQTRRSSKSDRGHALDFITVPQDALAGARDDAERWNEQAAKHMISGEPW